MPSKTLPLILFLLLLGRFSLSQEAIHLTNGCAFANPPDINEAIYFDDDSTKVAGILKEILEMENLDYTNFEIKSSTISTAAATIKDGRRYIFYNERFIREGTNNIGRKWKIYSVLAHELAHHFLGHDFFDTTNVALRIKWELQADRFSGKVLRAFCSEIEDALLAIEDLDPEVYHPYYPPIEVRKDVIADGWIIKDDELTKNGRDPCGQVMPLTFGENYKNINHAKNVQALIKEEEMVITFDDETAGAKNGVCLPFLVASSTSNINPESVTWKNDRNAPGANKEVIWNFANDGYTRSLVLKPQDLGIVSFNLNQVPHKRSFKHFLPGALGLILGGTGIVYGENRKREALQDYDIYKNNRDFNAGQDNVFSDEEDRKQFYEQTIKKHRNAMLIQYASFGAIGTGIALILNQRRKHRLSKIGKISLAANNNGISLTYKF